MMWKRKQTKSGLAMILALAAALAPAALIGGAGSAKAAGEFTVYAAQPYVAVTPGDSVIISIDLINNTERVQRGAVSVNNFPSGWEYELTSGGKKAREVMVKPDSSLTMSLDIDVPLQVQKGVYRFNVVVGEDVLPLAFEVTEQGTFETELTSDQPNIEGHADSSFSYSLSLRNKTADDQVYALRAEPPGAGWVVSFTSSVERVSSVEVETGATKSITVSVTPPTQVEAGTYKIPIIAETSGNSASIDLEAVIIGKYGIELTTPTGLLSTDVTAGGSKKLELVVKNTGTIELADVNLSSSTPIDWTVEFEPSKIDTIPPGESRSVVATMTSSNAALAGDYVMSVTASSPESSSTATFRVSVKTSVIWGWIGILIIVAVLGGLGYLFRKYGRR